MVIDLKNCTIEIRDGTTNKMTVKVGNGNLSFTEKVNMEYIKDRGKLDTVREGDEEPVDVRLDVQWSHITADSGDSAPTIPEALQNRGKATAWVSSATDVCEPYAVDIYVFDITPCAEVDETIILPDFRYESLQYDAKAGTIAVTGKCNVKRVIATRGAVSS